MEIVGTREGYNFKITGNKTFAVLAGRDDAVFCPFCYCRLNIADEKCSSCGKNIPQVIYYHGDDDTWIASGNE